MRNIYSTHNTCSVEDLKIIKRAGLKYKRALYHQDYLNKVRQIFSNGNGNGEIEYWNYRTCLGEEEKK